ncbi:prephenate dehydratase [Arthrobacter agilis]|uniref:prephenate dehydratase n=1 Tax=Arthrobacter agilis TaxID=37921 RepID=UPI000B362710|nr:prephenate dehydratase [Arthrobacter agilis]OUM42370.1 prephenate dehydratase [Arthrobacter agilis]PPB45712.1 prephenate dehydratase [Arthrobacter agilis]TPV26307.1 prephenate dehydratase [Arthrobacter agilis]VDR30837.1 Prephenate dehydratase [Arthrobacter agilis]
MTPPSSYTYLGPEGTFTEAALLQVPGAGGARRVPALTVGSALDAVRAGSVDAAMVPIENSVEGGVSATLDAIAVGAPLRILREELVPITFVLAGRPGAGLGDVRRIATHGHAWAQCRTWVDTNISDAEYFPASSTAAAAHGLAEGEEGYDAAICSPLVAERLGLAVLARDIGDVTDAVTRFVLVGRPEDLPPRTGADKTTLVIPLPEDHPGALMQILDQFAARGVNLSRIESRPTGQFLGDYFFSVDADGHVEDARVADALKGLHRISPGLRFLGSYARADRRSPAVERHTSDDAFAAADGWLGDILGGR